MKMTAHINEALLNLFSSKFRSLLALLGILVGTASVVAMILGGQLAENEALKQFKDLGTDLLAVTIKDENDNDHSHEMLTSITLTPATELVGADNNIDVVAPYTQNFDAIQFKGYELNGNSLGVTAAFAKLVHIDLEMGRFISDLDAYNFYCVIGHSIYNQIREKYLLDPIGQKIHIGSHIFTIIGVSKPWPENSFIYANIDDSILIPVSTALLLNHSASINNIIIKLKPNANIDSVKTNIEKYLHMFLPNNSFLFRSAKEIIAHMVKQTEIFTIFLGLIGGISLLVGGIGVMNIMLVSIVERQREIGIRRAIGATRSDIRYLFLIEALMLSLVGGGIGAMLGMLIAYIVAYFWNWGFTLFILPPVVGFSVSAATGIFFGFYPAHKASRLDPIESLRSI